MILSMWFPMSALTQSSNHLEYVLQKHASHEQLSNKTVVQEQVAPNEIKTAGLSLIRMYQILISSQDRPACLFSKSCSNFAMTALKTKGFAVGICLTSDRLQRCNELARHNYAVDPANGLAVDPMIEYILSDK